jgi:hypothetical protein
LILSSAFAALRLRGFAPASRSSSAFHLHFRFAPQSPICPYSNLQWGSKLKLKPAPNLNRLETTSHQPPATSHQPSIIHYRASRITWRSVIA